MQRLKLNTFFIYNGNTDMDMIMYKVNRTVNNVYKYIKDWVDGLFVKKNNDAGYILIDRNGEKYMAYEEIWEME